MTIRIVSWNINSVRMRTALIAQFTDLYQPDILCLQETKVENQHFPFADIQALGYDYLYINGQKSYHGVAILSKIPLKHARSDSFLDNSDTRHISAMLPDEATEIHNFYVPAGGDLPDPEINPKFKDKLAFLDAMTHWSSSQLDDTSRVVLLGDLNIAPGEQDVWSHKQLLNVVSHTPVEVEKLTTLKDSSRWIDVAREYVDDSEKLYSWWSYRARDWAASDRGRRLDHIWVTPALETHVDGFAIAREARGWDSPSDHVPVIIDLKDITW